jgi:iron complex outermembrane receptor protein
LTDKLRLNGGLRYTHDTIDQSSGAIISLLESPAARAALFNFYTTGVPGVIPPLDPATAAARVAATFAPIPATCADTPYAVGGLLGAAGQSCTNIKASFKPWTYTFGADYKPSRNQLIYAKYSKGYRPGGVNELAVAGFDPKFAPETDYSAEVGIKADWHFGDVFLRTNLTGFWDRYKDVQKLIIAPTPGGATVSTIIRNVDNARIRGIEAEVTLVPVHGLTFNGTFGYIDAKYRGTGPFVSLSACDPNATAVIGFCPFNKFNQTPKYSYSLAVDYLLPGIPTDYGEVHFGGTLAGRSKMPLTDTSTLNPFAISRAITTIDLNASWRDVLNQPVDLGFFVTNLTNEKYTVGSNDLSQNSSIGPRAEMWSTPRMWGFTFKYRFGSDAR